MASPKLEPLVLTDEERQVLEGGRGGGRPRRRWRCGRGSSVTSRAKSGDARPGLSADAGDWPVSRPDLQCRYRMPGSPGQLRFVFLPFCLHVVRRQVNVWRLHVVDAVLEADALGLHARQQLVRILAAHAELGNRAT
jgi:hypothetical protein